MYILFNRKHMENLNCDASKNNAAFCVDINVVPNFKTNGETVARIINEKVGVIFELFVMSRAICMLYCSIENT